MQHVSTLLVFSLLLAAGPCQTSTPAARGTSTAPTRQTAKSVAAALGAAGFQVKEAGTISQPFFSVPARVLVIDEADLQVYEYPTPESAAADAAKISPSGSPIGTSMPNWMRPPHIFHKDNLILIYLGDSPRLRTTLETEMGAQFAGAR